MEEVCSVAPSGSKDTEVGLDLSEHHHDWRSIGFPVQGQAFVKHPSEGPDTGRPQGAPVRRLGVVIGGRKPLDLLGRSRSDAFQVRQHLAPIGDKEQQINCSSLDLGT